jgi:rhamnulokinase
MAQAARPGPVIDPNDPAFSTPGNIPARIQEACRQAGKMAPDEPGAIIRCVFDSLAASYAAVLHSLTTVTGRTIKRIHIVGSGAKNQLLNRLTAEATGCTITAGPFNASTMGNALVQAMALKAVSGLKEAREIVRRSIEC